MNEIMDVFMRILFQRIMIINIHHEIDLTHKICEKTQLIINEGDVL